MNLLELAGCQSFSQGSYGGRRCVGLGSGQCQAVCGFTCLHPIFGNRGGSLPPLALATRGRFLLINGRLEAWERLRIYRRDSSQGRLMGNSFPAYPPPRAPLPTTPSRDLFLLPAYISTSLWPAHHYRGSGDRCRGRQQRCVIDILYANVSVTYQSPPRFSKPG